MTIQESFQKLYLSLTDDDKKAITNYMFNNGLPGYPSLFHPPKDWRHGQTFLNRLPIKIGPEEPYSEIFYAPDSLEIKMEIMNFQQNIFNDPIQEQSEVKIPEGFVDKD